MSEWKRPPGPPNVWRVIDLFELQDDGTKKPVKITVQEVPDEKARKDEVIELMRVNFLVDEPITKTTTLAQHPEIVIGKMRDILEQNISIGCYKVNSDGKIGELIGTNLMYVSRETVEGARREEENMEDPNVKKVIMLWTALLEKSNILEERGIDEFLSSFGLSVNWRYRGQRLGVVMLEVRHEMALKYGFKHTMTFFTANSSQKQAQRAGFEDICTIEYSSYKDKAGNPLYPGIESPCVKLMYKKLP